MRLRVALRSFEHSLHPGISNTAVTDSRRCPMVLLPLGPSCCTHTGEALFIITGEGAKVYQVNEDNVTLRDSVIGSWGDVRSVFIAQPTAAAAGRMVIGSGYANFVGIWEVDLKVRPVLTQPCLIASLPPCFLARDVLQLLAPTSMSACECEHIAVGVHF
jgi:hypothetical protein